jgi:hypothetical protein
MGEEARVAPLLVRMENITKLHREGLMSHVEFETMRAALVAEIGGVSGPSVSSQKKVRLRRAEEVRQCVNQLEKLMQNCPERLPDEYYEILESLPPKFTREVFEQDEWGNAGSGPLQEYYNSIAGRTIEEILRDKNTKLDEHNNPLGSEYDLPRDGTMQENTLLLCWFSEHGTYGKPVDALRNKGFKVIVHNSQRSTVQQMMVSLLTADVVWLVSGASVNEPGFDQLLHALEAFHRRGGGIFVWGDNSPYYAHANMLLGRLLPGEDIFLDGNDRGSQIMRVHSDGTTPGHLTRHHLIMTGLNSLYEGVTISHLSRVGPLKVLATYNNGPGYVGRAYSAVADAEVYQRCRAPYKIGRGRLVIDGGFTKLYDECWSKTAGTERYVKNASAWLLNMNSRIASEDYTTSNNEGFQLPTASPQKVRSPAVFSDFANNESACDGLRTNPAIRPFASLDTRRGLRNGNRSYRDTAAAQARGCFP